MKESTIDFINHMIVLAWTVYGLGILVCVHVVLWFGRWHAILLWIFVSIGCYLCIRAMKKIKSEALKELAKWQKS